MKILHYNIHMWTDADGLPNSDRVEELINDEAPDLISLVEIDEPWGRPSALTRLADRLGYSWAFVPAFEYRDQGGFGNALLSRAPLRSVQQWQLLSPRLYEGSEPSEPRAIILASVDADGTRLTFASTHLPRYDSTLREEASTRLLELLDNLQPPWIVCGDFNQSPTDWLTNEHNVAPSPPLATYPTKEPVERIDYAIYAGLDLTAETRLSLASDHLPIVITTALPPLLPTPQSEEDRR